MNRQKTKRYQFYMVVIFIFYSIPVIAYSSQVHSDSIKTKQESGNTNANKIGLVIPDFRLGLGFDISQPNSGVNLKSYYKGFGSSLTYGFSKSTNNSKEKITDIKNSLQLKVFYCFAAWYGPFFYDPIYAGFGYNHINEKENVKGFSGKGTIKGFNYFLGLRFLKDTRTFFKHFGGHIEIGFNSWDFDESVLNINNSTLNYNYPSIYFNLGLYYYIF
ncbi:MAG: hypothetical protein GF313_11385 [Caldithrix sp.]|nr:hypothetical protein [Caldithrix sp.]